jgi:hypothetical protein
MKVFFAAIFISFVAVICDNPAKPSVSVKILQTVEDLKILRDGYPVVVVGYFKSLENNTAYAAFKNISSKINEEDIAFAVASEQELFDNAKLSDDKVVLYKDSEEERADLTREITQLNIFTFVFSNRLPLVIRFSPNEEVISLVFNRFEYCLQTV